MNNRLVKSGRGTLRAFIILSVLLIAVFALLPIVLTAVLSTRTSSGYGPSLLGDSGAGFENYKALLGTYYLPRLLRNTAVLTICPAAMTAVIAFLLILAVSYMPGRACKTIALMLLAVPSFVPLGYLTCIFSNLFSYLGGATKLLFSLGIVEKKSDLLTAKEYFLPIYTVFEALRYMFFPVLAGVIALEGREGNKAAAALKIALVYILVRISMAFIADNEMLMSLYRPVTYEVADTFASFVYRRGMVAGDFGFGAAFEILRFIAQCVLNVGVFFALKALFSSWSGHQPDAGKAAPAPHRSGALKSILSVIAYLILASGAIFVSASLLLPQLIVEGARLSFEGIKEDELMGAYFLNSFIYAILRAALFAAVSFIIAYPLAARSKAVWPIALITLSAGGLAMANYIIFKELDLIYTRCGAILFGSFSCVGAVALAISLRSKPFAAPTFREYAYAAWRGALVLFLLGFALSWSSTLYAYTVLADRTLYPISVVLREIAAFDSFTDVDYIENLSLTSGITLAASLPPIIAAWSALLLRRKLPSSLLSAGVRV